MGAANCPNSYSWADNSSGNDPCYVASTLISVCSPSGSRLQPLGSGQKYPSPSASQANQCTCSTVVYALAAACADCQGGSFGSWNEWSANCKSTSEGFIPVGIPSGAETPNWAYDPSMYKPGYDSSAAYHEATGKDGPPNKHGHSSSSSHLPNTPQGSGGNSSPSVTSSPSQTLPQKPISATIITMTSTASDGSVTEYTTTSTLSDFTTADAGQSTTNPSDVPSSTNPFEPDPTQSRSNASSGATQAGPVVPIGAVSKKSNTGAIVGGVIGGLLILLLVGLLLRWCLVRWRRAHMAPSTAFLAEYGHERPKSWAPLNDSTAYLTSQRFAPEDDPQYQEPYVRRVN